MAAELPVISDLAPRWALFPAVEKKGKQTTKNDREKGKEGRQANR
jgi:hypothetical protein